MTDSVNFAFLTAGVTTDSAVDPADAPPDGSFDLEGSEEEDAIALVGVAPEEDQTSGDESQTGEIIAVTEDVDRSMALGNEVPPWLFPSLSILFCVLFLLVCVLCMIQRRKLRKAAVAETPAAELPMSLRVGKLHHIGQRQSQQDSIGIIPVQNSVFAVLADGMGGLSGGDRVSQKIVQTMLDTAANRSPEQISNHLPQLLAHVNTEVNQMLGYSAQYKSGSTLLAVLAEPEQFRWIAVGDSRIYLFRGGGLLQLNHEHIYEEELLKKAVNRELTFSEVASNPKGKSVTSFVGMGELRHIDRCVNPVSAQRGDRVLIMSDGVFNALSDQEISELLIKYPDGVQAAEAIEAAVLARSNPNQDNLSAILIDYC